MSPSSPYVIAAANRARERPVLRLAIELVRVIDDRCSANTTRDQPGEARMDVVNVVNTGAGSEHLAPHTRQRTGRGRRLIPAQRGPERNLDTSMPSCVRLRTPVDVIGAPDQHNGPTGLPERPHFLPHPRVVREVGDHDSTHVVARWHALTRLHGRNGARCARGVRPCGWRRAPWWVHVPRTLSRPSRRGRQRKRQTPRKVSLTVSPARSSAKVLGATSPNLDLGSEVDTTLQTMMPRARDRSVTARLLPSGASSRERRWRGLPGSRRYPSCSITSAGRPPGFQSLTRGRASCGSRNNSAGNGLISCPSIMIVLWAAVDRKAFRAAGSDVYA